MSELSDQEFIDRMTLQGWAIQLTCLPGGTVTAFGFWQGWHFEVDHKPSINQALTSLFEQGQTHAELTAALKSRGQS